MSGGTRADVGSVGAGLRGSTPLTDAVMGKADTMGLSPRQIELNRLWSYYRCENYDSRTLDWDGSQRLSKVEHEFVATSQYVPPGYYDAGQTTPLKFRKPDAPYYLGKMIPDRFTSMLFGEGRYPLCRVVGDKQTEDWLGAVVAQANLWAQCIELRNFGGATGSTCIGFKIVDGVVRFEVHDPRLCTPIFLDPQTGELDALEKRYIYEDWIRDGAGKWVQGKFWYRRVIDRMNDTVWPKVPVEDDLEPEWEDWKHTAHPHNLGEVPIEWIQNRRVSAEIDGDPDCKGAYDKIEAADRLEAQAIKGTIANCDPTLHVASDDEFDGGVAKGSGTAIKTEKGGNVQYVEIGGEGPKTAEDLANKQVDDVLQLTRCVLDFDHGGPQRTATEVDRRYSAMIDASNELRMQYGPAIKSLLEKLLRAAQKLSLKTIEYNEVTGTSQIVQQIIYVPPREVTDHVGNVSMVERVLGQGRQVHLEWPPYFQPTLADVQAAVTAAGQAMLYGLMDDDAAIRFVAPYFKIKDPVVLLEAVRKAKKQVQAQQEQQMMNQQQNAASMIAPPPIKKLAGPPPMTSKPPGQRSA